MKHLEPDRLGAIVIDRVKANARDGAVETNDQGGEADHHEEKAIDIATKVATRIVEIGIEITDQEMIDLERTDQEMIDQETIDQEAIDHEKRGHGMVEGEASNGNRNDQKTTMVKEQERRG